LSAISAVIGKTLALPRTPSVPKISILNKKTANSPFKRYGIAPEQPQAPKPSTNQTPTTKETRNHASSAPTKSSEPTRK